MSESSLVTLPGTFATTREHLHQLAFYAVSPARYKAVGRMGLRHEGSGFGTPEFEGRRLQIEGDRLIHHGSEGVTSQAITTIRQACGFFGIEYQPQWFPDFHDPLQPFDPDLPLAVDPVATEALGSWYGFAWDVLESLRGHAVAGDDPSEVQLWPEHFDAATELGDYEKGQRASYGASPGDDNHPEPYLYVSAWSEIDRSNPYWNDEFFNGSSLSYRNLLESDDPEAPGLEFFLAGHWILHQA